MLHIHQGFPVSHAVRSVYALHLFFTPRGQRLGITTDQRLNGNVFKVIGNPTRRVLSGSYC